MKKTLIISLGLLVSLGLTGCAKEESETATTPVVKEVKAKPAIKVLGDESLPGRSPVSAARNVRDLTNNSTSTLENLLKEAQ